MKSLFFLCLLTIVLLKVISKKGEEMKVYIKISTTEEKDSFKILLIERYLK
ncbi:hypothetical protein [uncultured Cetobacterium sp.]|uniref:hypothetical protein n=1 Tax=uncultured Cetobacterium sp. TaxID=527638 RepID=UPI002602BA87|nr:hypothetical protein [uncultured Cetobacterium sp.]